MLWTLGGDPQSASDANPLAGHFFLGSPIAVDDQLLVLTESRGHVHLVGLEARTGSVRFIQGLALLDHPVTFDSDRLRLNFIPAVRDGRAICPTPCGVIVAFDLASRTLEWTAQYRPLETASRTSWRGDGRSSATIFPVQPVCTAETVLILPPDSTELIAHDPCDGTQRWSVPRRGAHQIAVSGDGSLLMLSSDRVSCLRIETGSVAWDRTISGVTGRGLVLGDSFLVPDSRGGIRPLNLATGRSPGGGPEILSKVTSITDASAPLLTVVSETASSRPGEPPPLAFGGNLAAAADRIISVAPLGSACYIESAPMLAMTESGMAERTLTSHLPSRTLPSPLEELVQQWSPRRRAICLAELQLTLGDETTAGLTLEDLLACSNAIAFRPDRDATFESGTDRRTYAESLLRELLFARLNSATAQEASLVLSRLDDLCHTAADRARWRVACLNHATQIGDPSAWRESAAALAAMPASMLVPIDAAHTRQVSPQAVIRRSHQQLLRRLDSAAARRFNELIARDWSRVVESVDSENLHRFIGQYPLSDEAQHARLSLARIDVATSTRLQAEVNLLQLRRTASGPERREAQRRLARLRKATIAPATPRSRLTPDDPAESIAKGRHFIGAADLRLTNATFDPGDRRLVVNADWVDWRAPRVTVTAHPYVREESGVGLDLSNLLESRRELCREPGNDLRVLNLGEPRASTRSESEAVDGPSLAELVLVNRETAEAVGHVIAPSRARPPAPCLQPTDVHFLPLANNQVHGVSLLDAEVLWTARPTDCDRRNRPRVGPSGTTFCIVQTPAGLCCLDPLTGQVRWQRRDVPPDAGLYADEETGVFGDADRMVLVERDQRRCRVFDTHTGELMHCTELPTGDGRCSRLAFGSRLALVASEGGQPRFRVWDAATAAVVYDAHSHPQLRQHRVDRVHVAFVENSGDVIVINTRSKQEALRHPLSPDTLARPNGLRIWNDPLRWYVHTSHTRISQRSARTENVSNEVQVPSFAVDGDLTVYDRSDRSLLWSRSIENRTVLHEPRRPLPFVVLLSRSREGLTTPTNGLNVEVMDAATGLLLAQMRNLERTPIVHSSFDPVAGRFALHGEAQMIAIDYELPERQSLMTAENDASFVTR